MRPYSQGSVALVASICSINLLAASIVADLRRAVQPQ